MATAALRVPTAGAQVTYPYNYPFSYNQAFTTYNYTAQAGAADFRALPTPTANLRVAPTATAILRDLESVSPTANLRTVAGATANLRQR